MDLIHVTEVKSASATDLTNTESSLSQIISWSSSKKSHFFLILDLTDNILRCHVWGRGSQPEIDPVTMSATLLQAFTFALADYVTEYKLLQPFYNNSRYSSFEPPPSPRLLNPGKFSDETSMFFMYFFVFFSTISGWFVGFALDRNLPTARTFTMETTPTTPTIQSRRVSDPSISFSFVVSSISLLPYQWSIRFIWP